MDKIHHLEHTMNLYTTWCRIWPNWVEHKWTSPSGVAYIEKNWIKNRRDWLRPCPKQKLKGFQYHLQIWVRPFHDRRNHLDLVASKPRSAKASFSDYPNSRRKNTKKQNAGVQNQVIQSGKIQEFWNNLTEWGCLQLWKLQKLLGNGWFQ